MVINMVIVDEDVAEGRATGELIAKAMRTYSNPGWEMHVHVRRRSTTTTDDAYLHFEG